MKFYPRAWFEDKFSFFVLQCFTARAFRSPKNCDCLPFLLSSSLFSVPFFCEISVVIYPSPPFILAVHLLIMQVAIIAPPPYPRSCPPVLVLLFGTTGRAALEIVLLFPFMTPVRRGRDGPRRCLPAALGFPYSSLDVFLSSAWALGLIINGPEFPDPLAPQYVCIIYFFGNLRIIF